MSTLCYTCDKVIEERSDIRYIANHEELEESNGMKCVCNNCADTPPKNGY